MFRRLFAFLLIAFSVPASATGLAGRWALVADGTTLMIFTLAPADGGWTGAWERPRRFESDGDSFSGVVGPAERRIAAQVTATTDGAALVVPDPAPDRGAIPDRFVIRRRDAATVTLDWYGLKGGPVVLTSADRAPRIGGWVASRTYAPAYDRPTDPEMTAIFDADQAIREQWATADIHAVIVADRARRARTQALLDAGRLRSGDDFYHAAFVFQHGDRPEDYLKAHALAVIAAARGKPAATWIAAATLDRYLQSIGQPQVYGTQYQNRPGTGWTQEPYASTLLSDALRDATRVPPLADQAGRMAEFAKRYPPAGP